MELLGSSSPSECNLGILETLSDDAIQEITESYSGLFTTVECLIAGDSSVVEEQELASHVSTLCKYGLASLVRDHFLSSLQVTLPSFLVNSASGLSLELRKYS